MYIIELLHNVASHASEYIMQAPYLWIFIFMTVESSFIPFPSEVVMIPAGYLASTGKINFLLGFLMGLGGSVLGAIINYTIGCYGGVVIIKKLIGTKNNDLCVKYFQKHGDITTLIGRFIPAIRQLISLPAGAFKMNFKNFIIYTTIGAGIWAFILMIAGYIVGENIELFMEYKYPVIGGTILLISLLVYAKVKIIKYINRSNNEN
ncbi:MAG: DedA family protein [Candidatus Absconditabacteria bacterium]